MKPQEVETATVLLENFSAAEQAYEAFEQRSIDVVPGLEDKTTEERVDLVWEKLHKLVPKNRLTINPIANLYHGSVGFIQVNVPDSEKTFFLGMELKKIKGHRVVNAYWTELHEGERADVYEELIDLDHIMWEVARDPETESAKQEIRGLSELEWSLVAYQESLDAGLLPWAH